MPSRSNTTSFSGLLICSTGNCSGDRYVIYMKIFFYDNSGETLAQVAQRGGRCSIPGNIQGQVEWGSEHPDPVADVPAHCRAVGLDDL